MTGARVLLRTLTGNRGRRPRAAGGTPGRRRTRPPRPPATSSAAAAARRRRRQQRSAPPTSGESNGPTSCTCPPKYTPRPRLPLILAFHGRGNTGAGTEEFSKLSTLPADRRLPQRRRRHR